MIFCFVTQIKKKKENIRIVVVTKSALMTFVAGASHNSHKKSKSVPFSDCIAVSHFPSVEQIELKVTGNKKMVFKSKVHHMQLFASLDGAMKSFTS